jgi:hypothetical protein
MVMLLSYIDNRNQIQKHKYQYPQEKTLLENTIVSLKSINCRKFSLQAIHQEKEQNNLF